MTTFWLGVLLTIIYFLGLWGITEHLNLVLMTTWNEFGDFLAGAFSPVAFLWLVLGYMQQQKELQLNTQALQLQATELRNSVEQYEAMVKVAREQLISDQEMMISSRQEKEAQFKPRIKAPLIFPAVRTGGDNFSYRPRLEVAGEDAENLLIQTEPEFQPLHGFSAHSLKSGTHNLGESPTINIKRLPDVLEVTIKYDSRLNIPYVDKYIYKLVSDGSYSIIDNESS